MECAVAQNEGHLAGKMDMDQAVTFDEQEGCKDIKMFQTMQDDLEQAFNPLVDQAVQNYVLNVKSAIQNPAEELSPEVINADTKEMFELEEDDI